ncbi:MAG: permease-like cell division protein FtsX, partial [Thermodesulfobacteriota bacterium]
MTMLTVALSVLIFSFFYFLYSNMLQSGDRLTSDIKLIVYLNDKPSPVIKDEIEKKIIEFNPVKKIEFISPGRAFKELESQLGSEKDILTGLNP